MRKHRFDQKIIKGLLLGCVVLWLCVWMSGIAQADAVNPQEEKIVRLEDGTLIQLTTKV